MTIRNQKERSQISREFASRIILTPQELTTPPLADNNLPPTTRAYSISDKILTSVCCILHGLNVFSLLRFVLHENLPQLINNLLDLHIIEYRTSVFANKTT